MEEQIMYFMFSASQLKMRKQIEQSVGKDYKPGTVIVQGKVKYFTEILDDPKKSMHTDSVIVTSGVLSKVKYNENGN